MIIRLLLIILLLPFASSAQKTMVEGVVKDAETGQVMPFVTVRFQNSKIGTHTDTNGYYMLNTYYATDSLVFSFAGYLPRTVPVNKDQSQEINISLGILQTEFEDVIVKAPDEFPSTILHKKVIAHKEINNKEKLDSYEYEVYNKIQLDLNNIGDKFEERGMIKRLDLVMAYLDSTEGEKSFLPLLLSESVSDFYFKNDPKKKKEIVKATRISGVDNLEVSQFLGDMYLDVNVYDNYIILFGKSFVSPVADFARGFYRFYLDDSTFIDNKWCYKLRFIPKRDGDVTFQGEMWIHDTTYAVKQFKADISPWVNINYVQGLYLDHKFDMVAPEVWMLTNEKMIVDLKITRDTDIYGFYARRNSSRRDFVINKVRSEEYYKSSSTVEVLDSASNRSAEYWSKIRHEPLSAQEAGIDEMIDSLNQLRFFKFLKNFTYFASTGYWRVKKIEVGNAFSFMSVNPVEKFRMALALRTSNDFSHRIELGGKVAYGFGDERFKYGGRIRFNVSPKKRGMLETYYNYDIEQIGQSPTAAAVGSTFGTLLRTGPLDKLTFVEKAGMSLEKDVGKDFVLFGGFEWKEYTALGLANYVRVDPMTGLNDTISRIQTGELTGRIRWGKDEDFISGVFDRTSVGSRYPIFSVQGIFAFKDLFGSDYEYQKLELTMEHSTYIGVLGKIKYNLTGGYIFGSAAYPFLQVHAGNQSYWLMINAYNKMNFFEFISDKYVTAFIENHWEGLFFDRLPFNKWLRWRLVTTVKMAYGQIDDTKHEQNMLLPEFTKRFGDTPYVEVAAGIENIFNIGRVDVFWRLTHNEPGSKVTDLQNFGIRARYSINF